LCLIDFTKTPCNKINYWADIFYSAKFQDAWPQFFQ
jgi:hypothetical protein